MSRGWRALVGVMAVGVLLSGCSGAGALQSADGEGITVCTPQDALGRVIFGVSFLQNTSSRSVMVTDMELVDAEGLVLIGGLVLDLDDPMAHYVGNEWETRGPGPVTNTEVQPGARKALTVGLQAQESGGSARAVRIAYLDQHRRHTVDTRIEMVVVPAGGKCHLTTDS